MNQQDKPLSKLSGWEEGLHFTICTTTMCAYIYQYLHYTDYTLLCAKVDWLITWIQLEKWHVNALLVLTHNMHQLTTSLTQECSRCTWLPTRPSACIVIMKYPFPRFSVAGGDLQRKARVRKSVSASISCSQSTKEGNICQGVVPGINKVSYWFTDRHLPENMLAVFPPP